MIDSKSLKFKELIRVLPDNLSIIELSYFSLLYMYIIREELIIQSQVKPKMNKQTKSICRVAQT